MKIAICICTYKRPELLERLLNSLHRIQLGQLEPSDVRMIIVDNYPNGQARTVCERSAGRLPIELDFVEERQAGVSFARNRAVAEALRRDADFVAFLDDDDLPQPDWLLHLVENQKETRADIVGSVFPPAVNPDWPQWLRKSPLFDDPKQKSQTKYGAPSGIGIGSTLISRCLIERLKAEGSVFSSKFGMLGCEDADFFARAGKLGAIFSQTEKSIVKRSYEEQRLTVIGLLRDAFRIGNCIRQLLEKYGTPAQIRQRKIKAFRRVFSGLIAAGLQFFSKTLLVRRLYQVSKELGVIFGYGGSK